MRFDAPIERRINSRKTARNYTCTKRRKGIPKEVRPGARNRLLGMTVAELDHLIHSRCCATGFCFMLVSTELCIQARINNVCKTLKELTSWVATQLESFETSNGREYRIRGRKVCRTMWERYYGIGKKTMARALKLSKNNKTFYISGGNISGRENQDDWIYSLMFEYFQKNVETIADGIWHLQKVDDFKAMYKSICEDWNKYIPGLGKAPGPPPPEHAVKRVRKRDWSFVKEMRVGEFGVCSICWKLQQDRDAGFLGERAATHWRNRNDLHHKIHQICRKSHQVRIHQAAVTPQWTSCFTIDMSRPFYIPSARRVLDDFKGKHVMPLYWGGAISFGGQVEYILVHGPGIKKGTNTNLTFLYHILRADLWDPATMSADHLDLDFDGDSGNVSNSASMMYNHYCYCGIRKSCQGNRLVVHHTHNIQDQRHYVTRYFGWNKTLTTTNLAQGLHKMLLGYRNSGKRVVILLLTQTYDWDAYFEPCFNHNVKYQGKPLGCRYEASPVAGGLPVAFYKQMGDANPEWCGEGGVPGAPGLQMYIRPPVLERPEPVPPVPWVTDKIQQGLTSVFKLNHMGEEEKKWMKEIMLTGNITRIVKDGSYGDDNLPGYPAHVECPDKNGHLWKAEVRVLEELPPDLWGIPPNRVALQQARVQLTPEEEARLPFHRIHSLQPTPAHPRSYPGARELTEEEQQEWRGEGVNPLAEVERALAKEGQTEATFAKDHKMTMPKLKAYCKHHKLPLSGKKADLIARVWSHSASASAQDDTNDSQADDSDEQGRVLASYALDGNSDLSDFSSESDS